MGLKCVVQQQLYHMEYGLYMHFTVQIRAQMKIWGSSDMMLIGDTDSMDKLVLINDQKSSVAKKSIIFIV